MKTISKSLRVTLPVFGMLCCLSLALPAETITGSVLNKTTNGPASNDDVILLKLVQGMQEAARTKTDAKGNFTLKFDDDGAPHLLRVIHSGVNYHQPAPQGTHQIQMEVFDAAPQVTGVSQAAYVMRTQTEQDQLQVVLLVGLKNDSSPPKTQMQKDGFDIYLPENAVIDGAVAGGPEGMPVTVGTTPLQPKGHYGVMYPVRPGETRLQIGYHLPYSGSAAFSPNLTMPSENMAVLLPKTMQVKSNAFQQHFEENGAVVYLAKNVQPGQPFAFTVTGTGQLPSEQAQTPAPAPPPATGPVPTEDRRPGGGLGTPETTSDPLQKYRWWILGGVGLALASGVFFVLQKPAEASQRNMPSFEDLVQPAAEEASLAALKDELFRLEKEKIQGLVTEQEYAETKAALEIVLRRTLKKAAPPEKVLSTQS